MGSWGLGLGVWRSGKGDFWNQDASHTVQALKGVELVELLGCLHLSYSLNSLKGGYIIWGII